MARSVISNTHYRGNGPVPRKSRVKNHHLNHAAPHRGKIKQDESLLLSGFAKSGSGTLADIDAKLAPAIPLADQPADQGSISLIDIAGAPKSGKAKRAAKRKARTKGTSRSSKTKTANKAAAKKSAKTKAARNKAAAPKLAKSKAKSTAKTGTAKNAKAANSKAKASARTKSQQKTKAKSAGTRPARRKKARAKKQRPAIDAGSLTVKTGACGALPQGQSGFHLSTITSCADRAPASPWQAKAAPPKEETADIAPLPRSAAIQAYKAGGWFGHFGYWFRQSARKMLRRSPKRRLSRNGKIKIKAHEMLDELNRLAAENRALRNRVEELTEGA